MLIVSLICLGPRDHLSGSLGPKNIEFSKKYHYFQNFVNGPIFLLLFAIFENSKTKKIKSGNSCRKFYHINPLFHDVHCGSHELEILMTYKKIFKNFHFILGFRYFLIVDQNYFKYLNIQNFKFKFNIF